MEKRPNSELDKEFLFKERFYYSDPKLRPSARRASRFPKEKFCNLAHHLTEELIYSKVNKISSSSSAGPDEMTKKMTKEHLDWMLPNKLGSIHKKNYEAPYSKRVFIPKLNGEQRPIAIGDILDRGIQASVTEILTHIYEQDFLKCSFGFRPGRNCHQALVTLGHSVERENLSYLYEVDLKSFFCTLNHGWLEKFLRHRISDEGIIQLIKSWLKAGVLENGEIQRKETGTIQGGSISPLLANIYLHYVLDLWFEYKIRPRLKGKSRLIRYCDDCVPRTVKSQFNQEDRGTLADAM